jgi:O-succinylbenzoic acid--CoA ligase
VATRPPEAIVEPGAEPSSGLEPLPGVELRIVDAERRPLAPGEEGEIEVRGEIVMLGYLDDPEATARALRDGWLATGDIGVLDRRGRLHVLDRRSDLIVSGGENVYPAEVESILAAHPHVLEAGVAGLADERFGQRPVAFVVWRPDEAFDPSALAAWCAERLASFKRPVAFVRVDRLPRTASGKLLRRELATTRPARG